MMPQPPCARSSWRAGGGFTMSKTRNSRNPASAVAQVSGAAMSVTHIPITSSMTTGPGSVVPRARSACVAANAPLTSSPMTTAISTADRRAGHPHRPPERHADAGTDRARRERKEPGIAGAGEGDRDAT